MDIRAQPNLINNDHTKRVEMFNNSKKAIMGSVIYLILSIPIFTSSLEKILPTKSDIDIYKNLLLRTMLFSILFVLASKYI